MTFPDGSVRQGFFENNVFKLKIEDFTLGNEEAMMRTEPVEE